MADIKDYIREQTHCNLGWKLNIQSSDTYRDADQSPHSSHRQHPQHPGGLWRRPLNPVLGLLQNVVRMERQGISLQARDDVQQQRQPAE